VAVVTFQIEVNLEGVVISQTEVNREAAVIYEVEELIQLLEGLPEVVASFQIEAKVLKNKKLKTW
jgi:hypothetical protein